MNYKQLFDGIQARYKRCSEIAFSKTQGETLFERTGDRMYKKEAYKIAMRCIKAEHYLNQRSIKYTGERIASF